MTDDDDAPEWTADVFKRAEIKRGGEVVRPAAGTLTKAPSSMLERAARALSDHFNCEWEIMRDEDREMIRGYARAVLLAIRDSSGVYFLVSAPIGCDNIIAGYIDAILNETPE